MTEYIIDLIKKYENEIDDMELDLEDKEKWTTCASFILEKKYIEKKIDFLKRLILILGEMSKDYDKK